LDQTKEKKLFDKRKEQKEEKSQKPESLRCWRKATVVEMALFGWCCLWVL
jgi:hypothetical protein